MACPPTGRRSASSRRLVAAYAAARFAGVLSDNLRNALFEKVGQDAARRLAGKVFRHVHDLSLRFHLERRTGSLTKIVERGTKSIDMMLYFLLFNIAPTLIELTADLHHLLREVRRRAGRARRWRWSSLYIAFTRRVTDWRAQAAARDERGRQQGDRPRRRQPAQLRNGQIFRRRGARGEALRRSDRSLCACRRAQRGVARLAQHRPGADHQSDDGGRDDLHRLGLEPGPLHARRRRAGQHAC